MNDQHHLLNQLRDQCIADSQKWFPKTGATVGTSSIEQLKHHALAMAGEVGEFANLVKKIDRGDKSLQDELVRFDMKDELTDVLIYLLNLAGMLEVDLLQAFINKRKRNNERFGENGQA